MLWRVLPVLLLSGCAALQSQQALPVCTAVDVVTTVAGVSSGAMREANPLWRSSVNAGYYAPLVLAAFAMVAFVEWLDRPVVTQTVAAVECTLAAHNLWIIR